MVAFTVYVTQATLEMESSAIVSLYQLHLLLYSVLIIDFFQYSDIDECNASTHNCVEQASCMDTDGSFACTCNAGYTGSGITCTGMATLEIYLHE